MAQVKNTAKDEEKYYTKEQLEVELKKATTEATNGLILPKNYADQVFNTLSKYTKENRMAFPANYNLGNALTSAYLIIQQDEKLKACTQESIVQSMINMTTLGLNPRKQQCYFVPMKNKCTMMMSYFGKQAVVKRIPGIIDVKADVIYEATEYELLVDDYGNDDIRIIKPCPLKERKQEKIEGAWARIIMDENVFGTNSYVCIMTVDEIRAAHNMGYSNDSKAHRNFFGEMAKKTVINRCVKNFINTTDDESIIAETLSTIVGTEYGNEQEQERYYTKKTVNINDVIDNEEFAESNKKTTVKKEPEISTEKSKTAETTAETPVVEVVENVQKEEKPMNIADMDFDEFNIEF